MHCSTDSSKSYPGEDPQCTLGQLPLTSGLDKQQYSTILAVLKTAHWPWIHSYGCVEVFTSDIMYTVDNTVD